jgi:hypothetical protein
MPAELSVPITSQGIIPNGGKEGGSTIQSELGQDRKVQRQHGTESSESLWVSQKTERYGEPDLFLETISWTRPCGKGSPIALTRYLYGMSPEPTAPSASSHTIKAESAGREKP